MRAGSMHNRVESTGTLLDACTDCLGSATLRRLAGRVAAFDERLEYEGMEHACAWHVSPPDARPLTGRGSLAQTPMHHPPTPALSWDPGHNHRTHSHLDARRPEGRVARTPTPTHHHRGACAHRGGGVALRGLAGLVGMGDDVQHLVGMVVAACTAKTTAEEARDVGHTGDGTVVVGVVRTRRVRDEAEI